MPTLLAPPPIDDVTRRDLLRGAGPALLLVGCGRAQPASAPAPEPSERTVRHLAGTTTLAGTPQRITVDVRLPRPASQQFDDVQQDFSVERIPEDDADAVFIWSHEPGEQAEQRRLEANPLWKGLCAVHDGRVYEVGAHWSGAGPTSANPVLDDLVTHLGNGRAS